jgi:hypothetical protein
LYGAEKPAASRDRIDSGVLPEFLGQQLVDNVLSAINLSGDQLVSAWIRLAVFNHL